MAGVSLSNAWEESKRIFSRDGGLLSAVALGLLVLPSVIAGVVAPPGVDPLPLGGRVISLLATLVELVGQLALLRLALGPATTVADAIRHGARRLVPALLSFILLFLAIALILVPVVALLLAAGVIDVPVQGQQPSGSFALLSLALAAAVLLLAPRFMMATPVAAAEDAGPLQILKRTWHLTGSHYWKLLGLEMLLLVAALAMLLSAQAVGGVLARIFGGEIAPMSVSALILALFTGLAQSAFTVFASVLLARVYVQLSGRGEAQASVPSSVD